MADSRESAVAQAERTGLKPWQRVALEVDLPPRTAAWVLIAHVLTILAPILLIVSVSDHVDYLETVLDRPTLLYVTAGLFIVASVAESAQNTLDRWYLTAVPPTLLDLIFASCVIFGIAFQVLAVAGDVAWIWPAVLAVAGLFPVVYLMGWPTPPFQAVLGVASAVLLYRALDQPIVIFSLITVFFTLYFLDILLKTRQQVMHGFTTFVNAFSVVAIFAAISWAASNEDGWSWPVVVVLAIVLIGGAFAIRPALLRLPATPRRDVAA